MFSYFRSRRYADWWPQTNNHWDQSYAQFWNFNSTGLKSEEEPDYGYNETDEDNIQEQEDLVWKS